MLHGQIEDRITDGFERAAVMDHDNNTFSRVYFFKFMATFLFGGVHSPLMLNR